MRGESSGSNVFVQQNIFVFCISTNKLTTTQNIGEQSFGFRVESPFQLALSIYYTGPFFLLLPRAPEGERERERKRKAA